MAPANPSTGLSKGDTVGLTGEAIPITIRAEHLALIAKRGKPAQ